MVMYTSEGWIDVKLPPFPDLEGICRQTNELDDEEWQASKKNKENQSSDGSSYFL